MQVHLLQHIQVQAAPCSSHRGKWPIMDFTLARTIRKVIVPPAPLLALMYTGSTKLLKYFSHGKNGSALGFQCIRFGFSFC